MSTSFDVYLSRTYGLSWLVFGLVAGWTFVVVVALPDATLGAVAEFIRRGVPGLEILSLPAVSRPTAAAAVADPFRI